MSADGSKRAEPTDWARIEAMSDDEIDYSDILPLAESFFARAARIDFSLDPLPVADAERVCQGKDQADVAGTAPTGQLPPRLRALPR